MNILRWRPKEWEKITFHLGFRTSYKATDPKLAVFKEGVEEGADAILEAQANLAGGGEREEGDKRLQEMALNYGVIIEGKNKEIQQAKKAERERKYLPDPSSRINFFAFYPERDTYDWLEIKWGEGTMRLDIHKNKLHINCFPLMVKRCASNAVEIICQEEALKAPKED